MIRTATLLLVGAVGVLIPPLLTYVSTTGISMQTLSERMIVDSERVFRDVWRRSEPAASTYETLGCVWVGVSLLYWLPGPIKPGCISARGHVPSNIENGAAHILLVLLLFLYGAHDGLYPLSVFYDNLQSMTVVLDLCGVLLALSLYAKSFLLLSTADVARSENGYLHDFMIGVELYPRVLGFDIKRLVHSRFAMTLRALLAISCAAASYKLHLDVDWGIMVNAICAVWYVVAFFLWETGYTRSFSVIEDRAGFIPTWGQMVLVPAVYTSQLHFSVRRPTGYTASWAILLGLINASCTAMILWVNRQRQVFRETDGDSMLWWPEAPKRLLVQHRITIDGVEEEHEGLMLMNGFWGVVRHPQYVFELGGALTAGLIANPWRYGPQPLLYFLFMLPLLVHRAKRDSSKCRLKYGAAYSTYAANVPYMIVPGVY